MTALRSATICSQRTKNNEEAAPTSAVFLLWSGLTMVYNTIEKAASDEFVVKHSRFIGHAAPVTTGEQAIDFINKIKAKHWDATHNVYAYVLREGQIRRYSDDGEPQGTAGIPVLNVLLKEELTDCAVVVTRYFGGILLGGGGLVKAYSQGAKIAVDAGKIITMGLCTILKVCCDYNFYGRLPSLIAEFQGVTESTDFGEGITMTFRLPESKVSQFNSKLTDLSFGKIEGQKIGEIYAPI